MSKLCIEKIIKFSLLQFKACCIAGYRDITPESEHFEYPLYLTSNGRKNRGYLLFEVIPNVFHRVC